MRKSKAVKRAELAGTILGTLLGIVTLWGLITWLFIIFYNWLAQQ